MARWWEETIDGQGKSVRVRRSEILGEVAELSSQRQAAKLLTQRMQRINGDQYSPQATRKFVDFVRVDWEPVMLPTMKYATQKSYAYFLRVHLIPALGDFRLQDIGREPIQTMLNAKLATGLAWETVHHLQCALSKILGRQSSGIHRGQSCTHDQTSTKATNVYEGSADTGATEIVGG